jgi:uncharacterized oligopeptide transporter (OPT) family protein
VDKGLAPLPKLVGVDIRQLALSPTLDFAMIGAGGLMGIRTGASLLVGAGLNFVIVAPVMISLGEIQPRAGSIAEGTALFGRAHILNSWSLWWGIVMMVSHVAALFARPIRGGVSQPAGRRPRQRQRRAQASHCPCRFPGSACRS